MLPWCEGARATIARRWVLVTAGLHGRLCLAGRAGRQPAFARSDQWIGWDAPPREQAGAELVRELRARVFRPAGAPGIVLADGEPAGLWRARRKGRRLEVEVEELRPLDAGAVRAEALRLAPLRGCADVTIGSARS